MPEQLLDDAQVGAAFEEVRGERVAQAVRMAEEPAHGARVEPASARRRGRARRSRRAASAGRPVSQVARELERGLLAERHDALLAALAADVHGLAVEVDVGEVERDGLLRSAARRVEELEERAVAERERRVAVDELEQLLDLGRLRRVGKAARTARRERCFGDRGRAEREAQARANGCEPA